MTTQSDPIVINGVLVILTYDADNNVTQIVFPNFKDTFGNPMTITVMPGKPQDDIEDLIEIVKGWFS